MGSGWIPHNRILSYIQEVKNIDAMVKLPSKSSKPSSEQENKRPRLSLSLKRKKGDMDGSSSKDSINTHHQLGSLMSKKELSKAAKGIIPMNAANNYFCFVQFTTNVS